jgi:hypothetical protein
MLGEFCMQLTIRYTIINTTIWFINLRQFFLIALIIQNFVDLRTYFSFHLQPELFLPELDHYVPIVAQ